MKRHSVLLKPGYLEPKKEESLDATQSANRRYIDALVGCIPSQRGLYPVHTILSAVASGQYKTIFRVRYYFVLCPTDVLLRHRTVQHPTNAANSWDPRLEGLSFY